MQLPGSLPGQISFLLFLYFSFFISQTVVDECGQKAVEYERYINRSSDNEIKERWESKNGVTFTEKADMDIDSFKEAVDGVDEWFVNELKSQGYEDGQDLVDLFTK